MDLQPGYHDSSAQGAPPTPAGPLTSTCPLSSTSHWGDCHPSQSAMPSPPPTWIHPHSMPLSMPLSKLRTAAINTISNRSAFKPRSTKWPSTSWRKTSSMLSPISSTIRRPLSKPLRGTSQIRGTQRSPSPLGKEPMSLPNGSNSSTMDRLQDMGSMTGLETSPTSRKYLLHLTIALLTHQRFFPYGFGKPFKGHPCNTKTSERLSTTSTTGDSTSRSFATTSSTKPSSTIKPSLMSSTPSLPQLSHPDFNPLLGWKRHDFPSRFCIWQRPLENCLMPPPKEHGRRDADVHTKEGCDVIDLTNKDSSSNDKEL